MIQLRNVRVNNLKGIDLDIEPGELLLFCGLSGSGKSSLALDTLYAEGQRRYLECLSPQARRYLTLMDKPQADRIEGVPPAIAVEPRKGRIPPLGTVGSVTELSAMLARLISGFGTPWCPDCQVVIERDDPQRILDALSAWAPGQRYLIGFEHWTDQPAEIQRQEAAADGFTRGIWQGQTRDLTQPLADAEQGPLTVIVDRLQTGSAADERITESLETAFEFGSGRCHVLLVGQPPEERFAGRFRSCQIDGRPAWDWPLSRELECGQCGRRLAEGDPRRFLHTHRWGACPDCRGRGVSEESHGPCPACHGVRLGAEARAWRLGDQPVAWWFSRTLHQLAEAIADRLETRIGSDRLGAFCGPLVARLGYLNAVGLGYLPLSRSLDSLSAGEFQRVALTTCLGSTLVNTLYVLDEPSLGLHAADLPPLQRAIEQLHARGNTVILVDHREALIRAVPRVVEIGPGAGSEGGELVFDGSPAALEASGKTITADFLAGRRGVSFNQENRRAPQRWLRLRGASGHNLQHLNVDFPLGCLTVVTGVSGAGKSSLVQQTLYGALARKLGAEDTPALPHDELYGAESVDEVVLVDREPIGRSARSNPVTYVKAFDDIRRCFAETPDAQARNLGIGKFSFNAAGGRCDKCQGAGRLAVELQFLPEVSVTCDQCQGTRYREEILEVKYRGRNIAEVLRMTVAEAFAFFRGQPRVQGKLKALMDVGLGYLQLGQPAPSLSSGEAQRLKLGSFLNTAKSRSVLFLLDEPSSGLHMADVTRLLDCFDTLLSVGHSLIVIEHHLRLIQSADWILDLGPGAGEAGGRLVAAGTPEQVAAEPDSRLAPYLKF